MGEGRLGGSVQSRTEGILAAIGVELDRRRPEIDWTEGLRSVSVSMRPDERTGYPRSVLMRTENGSVWTLTEPSILGISG